jgi:uncharacterized repeat protein (TIGR03803 family)
MRSESTLSVAIHVSTCAMALALMLGFAAVSLAQAQTLIVLYSFTGGADGTQPNGLVRDSAGNLYGTARYGGDLNCNGRQGCGTAFKLDQTGALTLLHTFVGGADGSVPEGTLLLDAAGNLFGTTVYGGNIYCGNSGGCGTVFKLNAAGKKNVLYAFPNSLEASLPGGGVIEDANGNLYGTTAWGGGATCVNCGTVFKLRTTGGTFTLLHTFKGGTDGQLPYAGLLRDGAGNLFGTTYLGGSFNGGTAFKIDSVGKETVLHSFGSSPDGIDPIAGVVADGVNLYGSTPNGGAYSVGAVFKLDKSGNETVLHSFGAQTDGVQPDGPLVHDAAGNLYGVTFSGGEFGYGTVFKIDMTGKETILHSFGGGVDGLGPDTGVILDTAGNVYGTTLSGGAFGNGTIFKIAP